MRSIRAGVVDAGIAKTMADGIALPEELLRHPG